MIDLKEKKQKMIESSISELRELLIEDGWNYDSDDFFWTIYGFGISVLGNTVYVGTGQDYDETVWEGSIKDFVDGYMGLSGRPGKYGSIEIDHVEYKVNWR